MVLDNFRTIELIWDKANKSIIKTVKTASSDTTGRYLSVKILDGGQEVTLNNAKLQLYWEHPNFNTSGTDDFNTINNGGLFKMTFSDEMLTNVGELNAHLVLILTDGKITSGGFPIEVFKGADDGVVVPTNGSGLVEQVARKIDKGNVTLSDLTQEVKLAMTGGTVAVVGEDAVGTENIKDGSVTGIKISDDVITSKRSLNLLDESKFEKGGYYKNDTGVWTVSETTKSSPAIAVKINTNYVKRSNGTEVTFWDANMNYVSGRTVASGVAYFLVPNNSAIKYVRYSLGINEDNVMFLEGTTYPSTNIDFVNYDVINDDAMPKLGFTKKRDGIIPYAKTVGYFSGGSKSIVNDPTTYITGFIKVFKNDIFNISYDGFLTAFDENLDFVSQKKVTANNDLAINNELVAYVRFHWYASSGDAPVITLASSTTYDKVDGAKVEIDGLDMFNRDTTTSLIDRNKINRTGYMQENTFIKTAAYYSYGFIPVKFGNSYDIKNVVVRVYDNNKKYIRMANNLTNVQKTIVMDNLNDAYVHLTFTPSNIDNVYFNLIFGKNETFKINSDKLKIDANDPEIIKLKSANISKANSVEFLRMPTPYNDGRNWHGSTNQVTHPSVLYFSNGWNGWKFWMGYTPYPIGEIRRENPCVAVSNDGVKWEVPDGLTNPLVGPPGPLSEGGYNSDTHILLNPDTSLMEIWYRSVTAKGTIKTIYRQTSTDGINWNTPETMWTSDTVDILSPSIVYEDGKYRMWGQRDFYIIMFESTDGFNWTQLDNPKSNGADIHSWHPWVSKIGSTYYMLNNDKSTSQGAGGVIKYSTSIDGVNFTEETEILKPTDSYWRYDSSGVYRTTMAIVNSKIYIWYGMFSQRNEWTLGMTVGNDINNLYGIDEVGLRHFMGN